MTETVLVEDSVQVASEYLPVGADTTVQLSRAKGSEGFRVIEIRGFTNMNLIPGNSAVRQRLTEEPVTTDAAGAEAGHLLCLHRSADREQAKPRHAAVLLDPERVEELLAKHLHPAADPHHQAKPGVVANRLIEATLAHPLQVAHGLFTSWQDHNIRVRQRLSRAAEEQINCGLGTQRVEGGQVGEGWQ